MTTSELVAAVILRATGEVSTAASGDSEWEKIRGIANFYINTWSNEPGIDWNSLYDPEFSIGTISTSNSYELDDTTNKVSDKSGDVVRVDWTNGVGYTNFTIVPANELKRYYEGNRSNYLGNVCAQIGRNLVFNRNFVSTDPEYGGSIKVPVYAAPEQLVLDTDDVPVDDPNWLVVICAAEYVRTDVTLQGQYPTLVGEANAIMDDMKTNNETAQFSEITRAPAGDGIGW